MREIRNIDPIANGDVWFITTAGTSGGGGVLHSMAVLQAVSMVYSNRLVVIGRPGFESVPMPATPKAFIPVHHRTWLQKLWWLAKMRGYDLMSPFLDNLLIHSSSRPGLVFLDPSRIGRFAPIFRSMGIPVVTVHHNVELDYVRSTTPTPIVRDVYQRIAMNNEISALVNSRINLCMTDNDIARMRTVYDLPNAPVFETLGTFETMDARPLPQISDDNCPSSTKFSIVVTGSLCDYQTIDGILWFAHEILPRIRNAIPQVSVTIAGRNPAKSVLALACLPNVRIIANPPDMDVITRSADVYLAPAKLGSGLKLRLKDGLRVGLPVISHIVSARGYSNIFPEPWLHTFETADGCAEALAKLYRLGFCKRDRAAIQQRYSDHFAFNAGAARLRRILTSHSLA